MPGCLKDVGLNNPYVRISSKICQNTIIDFVFEKENTFSMSEKIDFTFEQIQ